MADDRKNREEDRSEREDDMKMREAQRKKTAEVKAKNPIEVISLFVFICMFCQCLNVRFRTFCHAVIVVDREFSGCA